MSAVLGGSREKRGTDLWGWLIKWALECQCVLGWMFPAVAKKGQALLGKKRNCISQDSCNVGYLSVEKVVSWDDVEGGQCEGYGDQ